MQDDRFERDDGKAEANLAKHFIDFADAKLVFDDPGALDEPDQTMDYGEDRYRIVGLVNGRLIAAFYTLRAERIRIISARKATRREAQDYGRQNQP